MKARHCNVSGSLFLLGRARTIINFLISMQFNDVAQINVSEMRFSSLPGESEHSAGRFYRMANEPDIIINEALFIAQRALMVPRLGENRLKKKFRVFTGKANRGDDSL